MARSEAISGRARSVVAIFEDRTGREGSRTGDIDVVAFDLGGEVRIGFVEEGVTRSCLKLDQNLLDVIGSLGSDRFYVCPGDETRNSCHIATTDLLSFARDTRPDLSFTSKRFEMAA